MCVCACASVSVCACVSWEDFSFLPLYNTLITTSHVLASVSVAFIFHLKLFSYPASFENLFNGFRASELGLQSRKHFYNKQRGFRIG